MRNTTEQPEAVDAGAVKFVGADRKAIVSAVQQLLDNVREYSRMSAAHISYGDGMACERIHEFLKTAPI